MIPLFSLGQIVATPGALAALGRMPWSLIPASSYCGRATKPRRNQAVAISYGEDRRQPSPSESRHGCTTKTMPNEPSPCASLLRSELCARNAAYAGHEHLPHVTSYGATPIVVYHASPCGTKH